MSEAHKVALPLLPAEKAPTPPAWNGWTPLGPLPEAPEPTEPQGVYNAVAPEMELQLPLVELSGPRPVELLAPAGGLEAGFAAFHFGADAIYLGLKKFSARAEAENFTLAEVDEITAYAHSLQPQRRVFVTINTLIRQDELAELVEAVAALAEIGVDALIVQDLGVYNLVRCYFPSLELHASTQLSVHNRAGAEVLKQLGFQRVVLARELTFEEVRDITAASEIETEVFIHGALCYSYSGLCLFSSQTLGRSGNRGKCAYSCRDSYEVHDAPITLRDGTRVKRDPRQGFPFSMKDLALPDHIPALRAAGVSCFKIEGRKKSPLYVATTTEYYRKLIDGRLTLDERPALEADMQTVFSRPWTRLFVQSHKDKEVADRDTVGHRGTLIGKVEAVHGGRLRFRTRRAIQRHDGLQIDLPTLGKPFGFAVDRLWALRKGKRDETIEAAAESVIEVGLPADHPHLPLGAPVYCSSSQAVKQRYRHERPKPGLHRGRRPVDIELELAPNQFTVSAHVRQPRIEHDTIEARRTVAGSFPKARDSHAMECAARVAFEKLGQTQLELASFSYHNSDGCFIPVSRLNQVRRDLVAELEQTLQLQSRKRVERITSDVCATGPPIYPKRERADPSLTLRACGFDARSTFRWSLKVDRISFLDELEDSDLADIDEVIVDIARDHATLLQDRLEEWAARLGRDHLRLALPALTRSWEDRGLRHKIDQLRKRGWTKWEAANLSAWSYMEMPSRIDIAADWSVYVLNRLAAHALLDLGVTRFALSPEDGLANIRSLLAEFGPRAVLIVYQDTPQFLAESCAYANLIGGCPGKANCRFESMEMVSSHGENVTALDYHCRTIVLNSGPFCLSTRLQDLAGAGAVNLRADFVYRPYDPATVRERWRRVRAGRAIAVGHAANLDRGIL
jgi:putative protease